MKKFQVKVPGKLYVAGEYAVVEPGYSAIAIAVNKFVYLTIESALSDFGTIFSNGYTKEAVRWRRVDGKVMLDTQSPELDYVLSAVHTVEEYVESFEVDLKAYHLNLRSELDSASGEKFGLGSSGAVTVAVVRGLLELYEIEINELLVYKLSVISQMKLGVNSSFGDLATSSFTGWVRYTNFDHTSVSTALLEKPLFDIVNMEWLRLQIESLTVTSEIRFLIGWTGSPVSSHNLVGNVQKKKAQSVNDYEHFLFESKASVDLLTQALLDYDPVKIKLAISKNRQALLRMGTQTNVVIETPLLTELCEIANHFGGAGKTSGAGGGDSGIAFYFAENSKINILKHWESVGITHLPIEVYTDNSLITKSE